MKKQIKLVVLNPERLSKNLTNAIADIFENRQKLNLDTAIKHK